MSKLKTSVQLFLAEDTPETKAIINWLRDSKIHFVRKTRHHIKIGPINFYPATGTIYFDDEPKARPERGLDALKELLTSTKKGGAATTREFTPSSDG